MSHFADYIKERENREIIEDDHGFATYAYVGEGLKECYIIDIYVVPDHRNGHFATEMADKIAEKAKKDGCTVLSGTVDPTTNGANDSLWVLLKYGMTLAGVSNGIIWFRKEL